MLGPVENTLRRRDVGRFGGALDVIEAAGTGMALDCQEPMLRASSPAPGARGSGGAVRFGGLPASAECSGGGGEGGGGGEADPYLGAYSLAVNGVCDNLCWETNEFEIYAVDNLGNWYPHVRCEGVGEYDMVYPKTNFGCAYNDKVHEHAPSEVTWLSVYVIETDGWPNGDDVWYEFLPTGPGPIYVTDNSAKERYAALWDYPGDTNCFYGQYPPCDARVGLTLKWLF